jgi:hypothetical protein
VSNRELAARAQQLAKASGGLQRRAAICAAVALGTTGTVAAARTVLEDSLSKPDLRNAALDLLEQLAADLTVKGSR